MPRFRVLPGFLVMLPALLAGPWAAADEYAEKSRAIAEAHGGTIVTVELVIELAMSMMGMAERSEEKMNAVGTVVHPDGWVLLTNSAVDPAGQYQAMLSMMPDGVSIESRVTSARVRYADGTEVDGQVVLRDTDMDLALLKPVEAPGNQQPHLDFSKAADIGMFDPAVILNRLGRVARYQLAGYTGRIEAVIDRPRLLYVMTGPAGAPVFTLDGEPIGICAQRTFGGAAMTSFSDFESNIMSVIVPGVDLVEFLEQGADAEISDEEPAADDDADDDDGDAEEAAILLESPEDE